MVDEEVDVRPCENKLSQTCKALNQNMINNISQTKNVGHIPDRKQKINFMDLPQKLRKLRLLVQQNILPVQESSLERKMNSFLSTGCKKTKSIVHLFLGRHREMDRRKNNTPAYNNRKSSYTSNLRGINQSYEKLNQSRLLKNIRSATPSFIERVQLQFLQCCPRPLTKRKINLNETQNPLFVISTKNKRSTNHRCSLGIRMKESQMSPLTLYRVNRGDRTTILPLCPSKHTKMLRNSPPKKEPDNYEFHIPTSSNHLKRECKHSHQLNTTYKTNV